MESIARLTAIGIAYHDAVQLRRISMTLHRWHELECGDGNDYGSWCITRGKQQLLSVSAHEAAGEVKINTLLQFVHDDDGKPYLEYHRYTHGKGKDSVTYTLLADRERGAIKRLKKIMGRYPSFASYVQGDPRGCALYIIQPGDVCNAAQRGQSLDQIYNHGVAVYK